MTKIKLTLGSKTYTEKEILYFEINKSVFLFGEYGTIVLNYQIEDIKQIPTTGSFIISDPLNPDKFSKKIDFILIGKVNFYIQNGQYLLRFTWLNKWQIKQISTNNTKSYKNTSIHDIIYDVIQNEIGQKQEISDVTNRYFDNPIIWYSNLDQLTFLKYLLPRQNPKENGFLLMYLLYDTIYIHTPRKHDIVDTITNNVIFTENESSIKEFNLTINSNFTIPRNSFQKNTVYGFNYTKEKDDYNIYNTSTYKDINNTLNKLFVTNYIGYNPNITINTILSGEDNKNIIESINSYLLNRMTFDNVYLKVKTMSKSVYDIDKSIKVKYYEDLLKKKINQYISGNYYIQQMKRVFTAKLLQVQDNMFTDDTDLILIKNDINIKPN